MDDVLQIMHLRPCHLQQLTCLFELIARDPESRYFHPHAFNAEEACRVCEYDGRDLYFGLTWGKELTGYGLLRGWDARFETPSLGLYIAPQLRGTGAARLLMTHLHVAAKLRGARDVRLKVYADNEAAIRLYRAMGYVFAEPSYPETQLTGRVSL
jgi:ribosomal protein S18 acetylase RimI-like enzyme